MTIVGSDNTGVEQEGDIDSDARAQGAKKKKAEDSISPLGTESNMAIDAYCKGSMPDNVHKYQLTRIGDGYYNRERSERDAAINAQQANCTE